MLKGYPSFVAFWSTPTKAGDANSSTLLEPVSAVTATPDDMIAQAKAALDVSLKEALLTRIMDKTPAFFERLVLDLLLKMGYGGFDPVAGQHTGGAGDGGIDALIHQDKLGLDRIYIQAKRRSLDSPIGPQPIQAFIGALVNKSANKGVFITTSSFTENAVSAATNAHGHRLVLIDGDALTELLVTHDVGVTVAALIPIKRINGDYFDASSAD